MQMNHPMFCGSLLYRFFGGPSRLAGLVDQAKGPVTFGQDAKVDGEDCRTVRFFGTGSSRAAVLC